MTKPGGATPRLTGEESIRLYVSIKTINTTARMKVVIVMKKDICKGLISVPPRQRYID